MKKTANYVTKFQALMVGVCALALSTAAQASNVDATILADNGSIAVLQQGSAYSVIPQSVAGSWPNQKTFSFDVPDDARMLQECRIHVISWGDGVLAQGVMAHFTGNAGVAYTGQSGGSLNNVQMSSVAYANYFTAAPFASVNANAQSIIQSPAGPPINGFTSAPATSGGISGIWGPVNLPEGIKDRNGVTFVWNEKSDSLSANPRNFRVISTPCASVARPREPILHVNSWEIAGQFQQTKNPYEVWTYGYIASPDCKGPLIPYTNKGTMPGFPGVPRQFDWWGRGTTFDANDLPHVSQTPGDTLLSPMRLSPHGISMHPGPQNQCSVVRFTVPEQGNYRMMGRFWAQNQSGTDTDTMIAYNGTIDAATNKRVQINGPVTNNHFELTGAGKPLAAGDTIDFMVGSRGSFFSDSTGLHGFIERVTP
jgi:hypothetical protein